MDPSVRGVPIGHRSPRQRGPYRKPIHSERAADHDVAPEMLIEKAKAILSFNGLDVRQVAWWSAYEIGQRVCDAFDDAQVEDDAMPRVFIAGDACHAHSPKAGQGMNVSMADAFNLGWKLAAVLRGQADKRFLRTYSYERRAKAQELIDFDRDMARLFSARPRDAAKAEQSKRHFKKHGRYTAGVATRYDPSSITGDGVHQALASGFTAGMRFHSATVIRLADAKPMQLDQVLKADGRWRLVAFAPQSDEGGPEGATARLCAHLADDESSPPAPHSGGHRSRRRDRRARHVPRIPPRHRRNAGSAETVQGASRADGLPEDLLHRPQGRAGHSRRARH